mmetsp:Transcript_16074/g.23666  ORF Transcript_16074/g.23666 Transcript_16074/m.23666 type:complete len:290 (-) Transcript_16074:508-1377(-)
MKMKPCPAPSNIIPRNITKKGLERLGGTKGKQQYSKQSRTRAGKDGSSDLRHNGLNLFISRMALTLKVSVYNVHTIIHNQTNGHCKRQERKRVNSQSRSGNHTQQFNIDNEHSTDDKNRHSRIGQRNERHQGDRTKTQNDCRCQINTNDAEELPQVVISSVGEQDPISIHITAIVERLVFRDIALVKQSLHSLLGIDTDSIKKYKCTARRHVAIIIAHNVLTVRQSILWDVQKRCNLFIETRILSFIGNVIAIQPCCHIAEPVKHRFSIHLIERYNVLHHFVHGILVRW